MLLFCVMNMFDPEMYSVMENWIPIFGIAAIVVVYLIYRFFYCKHRWEAKHEDGVYPVWYCEKCRKKKKAAYTKRAIF